MAIVEKNKIQPSPRIVIRNKAKELLKENVDVAERVFCSRPKPLFLTELPACLIYFTNEEADDGDTRPREYEKKLMLVTEVVHRLESVRDNALDDFLDSRAWEIEQTFFADRFMGLKGLVNDITLKSTEALNIQIEGDADIASERLVWEIQYYQEAFNNGELDEFLKFITEYKPTNNADAEDNVTIREE